MMKQPKYNPKQPEMKPASHNHLFWDTLNPEECMQFGAEETFSDSDKTFLASLNIKG